MNATAKALAASGVIASKGVCQSRRAGIAMSNAVLIVLLLLMSVWFSAFGVVYVKDINRQLVNDLQNLHQAQDALQVEWGQLLLEQGTLSTQARVQRIAHNRFDMVIPRPKAVEIVTP